MKVRSIFIFIFLAGYSLFTSCSESKEVRLQKFLLKGNLALHDQNEQEASRYFNEALRIDPCFADALNNLGTLEFRQNHWDEALTFYNKAIACRSGFLAAYFNRANTYYELKEYFNAQKDVGRIIAQRPDTAVAYFMQGLIATRMRDFKLALSAFTKALSLDSSNVEYLVNRGTVHYYLHEYDEGERDLRRAEKIDPKEANIYNTLAMIEIGRNNNRAAAVQIEKALSLSPDEPYYLNNRGFIFLMQNRLQEALLDIDRSILLDPNNGWAYRNKGIYHLLSGNYADAVRLIRQALIMDPFIDKIHFYYGMTYLKNNQPTEACEQFRKSNRMGDNMVTVELMKACK